MENILKHFELDPLYDGCSQLLHFLGIKHTQEIKEPMQYSEDYEGTIPQYVQTALNLASSYFYIGEICDESIAGTDQSSTTLKQDIEKLKEDAHYKSMMLFAVDLRPNVSVTRNDLAILTRAFNRLVYNFPVTVFFRQGEKLHIATCERTAYQQEWRQGEKLGRVSILRDVNCNHPHRGHLDILSGLDCSTCTTFDEVYAKWMKVFNSELLTKRFYSDLFDWYQWAVSTDAHVTFPNNTDIQEDDREDIDTKIIRLITRLMFVWFIKQKGLVPNAIFDTNYIASILKNFNPQDEHVGNYYNAILQNLFFGTLNRPIFEDGEGRGFAKATSKDAGNLYRYSEMFQLSEDEVIALYSKVPYLNCGLFECQDKTKTLDGVKKRYYNDGFSRNDQCFKDGTFKYRAVVPNVLFFHPDKGLISIFEKYVFTIEENTPQDIQVALDPELLGKVFENLLGAYNPETQETARNQSGSFYTPREIVQYMVNESLVTHLKRTVDDQLEPQFRQLLDYTSEDISLTEQQRLQIIHSLFTCKILDPACGSGAFPMGMLQQMVHILQQLDPDNKQWRHKMENLAADEARHAFGIENDEERNKKLEEIKSTFNNNLNSPDYTRKLYLIESCIYGVDIQPIAMLITRLRFFITLICEQENVLWNKPEDNYGIKTLPNLETKFVAANSLIDADIHKYNEDWTNNEELALLKNELIAIRRRHFYTRKRSEKISLLKKDDVIRQQIHQLINLLVGEPNQKLIDRYNEEIENYQQLLLHYQGENWIEESVQQNLFDEPTIVRVDKNKRERDRINGKINDCKRGIEHEYNKSVPQGFEAAVLQITDWNPYDQNSVSPFLDIEWMFGITDGFDIVIGNPPYIQLQANGGKLAELYKNCHFDTYTRMGDIYSLFYERGLNLLKDHGLSCFITSNKWMRAGYGAKTRKFFAENTNPILLIDFAGVQFFESATVDTNIFLYSKEKNQHKTLCLAVDKKYLDKASNNLTEYILENKGTMSINNDNAITIDFSNDSELKRKVSQQGTPLKDWDIRINYGLKTGYNDAFFITTEVKDKILSNCKSKEEYIITKDLIHPLLRGRDIKAYGINWEGLWLIWMPWHFPYQFDETIEGASELAEREFHKICPSLFAHLEKYKLRLSSRNTAETGIRYEWYALQRWGAKYWNDFNLPKIVYPNMTKYLPFYYDENRFLGNDKSFMIAGTHISYLTAFLNSSLFKFCFRDNFPELLGGTRELRKIFFDKIPVKEVDDATDNEFRKLVLDIQKEYTDEKAIAIDNKIFDLYGISPEDRKMIGYIDYHNTNEEMEEDDE